MELKPTQSAQERTYIELNFATGLHQAAYEVVVLADPLEAPLQLYEVFGPNLAAVSLISIHDMNPMLSPLTSHRTSLEPDLGHGCEHHFSSAWLRVHCTQA